MASQIWSRSICIGSLHRARVTVHSRDGAANRGIELWAEWLDTCEGFLLAGLRRQVGPDGDVRAAFRQWYAETMTEHDRTMLHLLAEFDRRSRSLDR
jgi:hypothetical protein